MRQQVLPVGTVNSAGKLHVEATEIADVKILTTKRFDDDRGAFTEVYNMKCMNDLGLPALFVQDNHSVSRKVGTVRGLHFQMPPHAQHKLVWVVRGAIYDVAVDLRKGSPWYGRHASVVLRANPVRQLFVPTGFAHGFCTLEPDTEVIYKVTDRYAPECEVGIFWNDPDLNIDWPTAESEATVSAKDMMLPRLRDLHGILPFTMES